VATAATAAAATNATASRHHGLSLPSSAASDTVGAAGASAAPAPVVPAPAAGSHSSRLPLKDTKTRETAAAGRLADELSAFTQTSPLLNDDSAVSLIMAPGTLSAFRQVFLFP
jgi:hypothetical protein